MVALVGDQVNQALGFMCIGTLFIKWTSRNFYHSKARQRGGKRRSKIQEIKKKKKGNFGGD